MVKILGKETHDAVREAILAAEKRTGAEIAVVVSHSSGRYTTTVMTTGLLLGSLLALILWWAKMLTAFPWLLAVQFAVIMMLRLPLFLPLIARLAPVPVQRRHARSRAAEEYMHLSHHLPAATPFVLLYISLAERYVHIYGSGAVRARIADKEWNAVVETLTTSIKAEGLEPAVIKAVDHAGQILKTPFPPGGEHMRPRVVERKE